MAMEETNSDTPTEIYTHASLEAVEKQFDKWRRGRKKIEPIPAQLWKAAADLCKTHPISHVSRRLRLSFPDLKKRLIPDKASPQFLELTGSCFFGQWQIICERPDGARLHFSGSGAPPSLEDVIRQFLS
jgi:hypothetical protein